MISKETQEQIEEEAAVFIFEKFKPLSQRAAANWGYQVGATRWAEKLVEFQEWADRDEALINKLKENLLHSTERERIFRKALEHFLLYKPENGDDWVMNRAKEALKLTQKVDDEGLMSQIT